MASSRCGSSSPNPYIGSLISLTSNSDVRYEGILVDINTQESCIGLSNVRPLGTEGRRSDGSQVPSDEIHEYMLFRASDIQSMVAMEASGGTESCSANYKDESVTPLLLYDILGPGPDELVRRPDFDNNDDPNEMIEISTPGSEPEAQAQASKSIYSAEPQLGADRNLIIIKNAYAMLSKDNYDVVPVSIFKVPNSVSESKPEAYVPKLVGIGPYNHFRTELQQMQTFKLAEVKKIRNSIPNQHSFELLVQALRHVALPPSARASYASYLDMDDESLAFVLAVDGLFLFELLRRCIVNGHDEQAPPGFFRDLLNFSQQVNGSARDIFVRDVMLLENQIPIYALKIILAVEYSEVISLRKSSVSMVTQLLPMVLLGFSAALSPLKVLQDYPLYKALKHHHLLDLLYSLVTLKTLPDISTRPEAEEEEREILNVVEKVSQFLRKENLDMEPIVGSVPEGRKTARPEEILGAIGQVALDILLPEGLSKPVKLIQVLIGLPWSVIVSYIKSSLNGDLGEEILIPSASELGLKGIKFCPVDRISEIKFDQSAKLFHLPSIKLDAHSEAVLRNLIAYEIVSKSEGDSLILSRYMELMGALTKSSEDVKSLEGTIIKRSSFEGDEAIVELFSRMSIAMRGTNVSDLDRVIADVKGYYDGLWSVCVSKFFNKWGRIALSCFVVIVVLVVCLAVLIMALRLVYEWLFSKLTSSRAQIQGLRGLSLSSYE